MFCISKKDSIAAFYYTVMVHLKLYTEPVFVNLLRSPRNRFPVWQAGTTTLFVVPARQACPGLLKSSQIRALPAIQSEDFRCTHSILYIVQYSHSAFKWAPQHIQLHSFSPHPLYIVPQNGPRNPLSWHSSHRNPLFYSCDPSH